jgi:hypothetical protein
MNAMDSSRDKRLMNGLVFLALMAGLNLVIFGAQLRFVRRGYSDFMHFYATGRLVRAGQARGIYDPQAQLKEQQKISEAVRARGVPVTYMHPPLEALLFAGLAGLRYYTAYWVWAGLNFIVLLGVLGMLRRELPGLGDLPLWWLVVGALAFYPVMNSFAEGQDDILALACIAAALVALRRRSEWMAGACLGLGMMRPQIGLPLVGIMAMGGQWRVAAGFAGTVAALVAVTSAVFGWTVVGSYPRYVLAAEQSPYVAQTLTRQMPNLHGLMTAISPHGEFAATIWLSVAVMVWAVWVWRRKQDEVEMAFAVAVLAALLVSYHSFAHDLSLLLLVAVVWASWLLGEWSGSALPRWSSAAINLPMLMMFVPPLGLAMALHGWFQWYALALGAWMTGISRWQLA